MSINRRRFLFNSALAGGALSVAPHLALAGSDRAAPFRTPYKYPQLVLFATGRKGDFDQRSIDDPIVFYANGAFQMLYIGWDGVGYQTGLATSADLVHWTRTALVAPRDPASTYTKFNLALSSILRDKQLRSRGDAIKVNGKYLGAWNAYPAAGYEEGAAVIGLATSDDLLQWQLTDPVLLPQAGAEWEHGGLYRPDLMLDRGTYYLYYNAKTDVLPESEGGGWHEQTGVATSKDLKTWTRYKGNPISATARAARRPILQRTRLSQPGRPCLTPVTAALLRIPSWFRTAASLACSITAFVINGQGALARCWPSGLILIPSSKCPKSSLTLDLPGRSMKPSPTSRL